MWIDSNYEVVEYMYTVGHQHEESTVKGYKIKIKVGKEDYFLSDNIYTLEEAIKKRDEYRNHDGY